MRRCCLKGTVKLDAFVLLARPLKAANPDAKHPGKAGKIPGGKLAFPWGLFPGFPRMQSIRVGRFQRPGQKHSVAKFSCFLQASAGICFFLSSSSFRRCGSREVTSLVECGAKPHRSTGYLKRHPRFGFIFSCRSRCRKCPEWIGIPGGPLRGPRRWWRS